MKLRSLRKDKRGQQMMKLFVGGVGGAIAFGVLVIVISLMAQVLSTQQDTQGKIDTLTETNETFTLNGTLKNAGTTTNPNNIDNTSEVVTNITSDVVVVLTRNTHYVLRTNGSFQIFPAVIDDADWQVNITYNYQRFTETAEYNISARGLLGFVNVGNLVPTLGLVFGIILVLGLLVGLLVLFGGSRLRGEQ